MKRFLTKMFSSLAVRLLDSTDDPKTLDWEETVDLFDAVMTFVIMKLNSPEFGRREFHAIKYLSRELSEELSDLEEQTFDPLSPVQGRNGLEELDKERRENAQEDHL